jgi:hypothetical protein
MRVPGINLGQALAQLLDQSVVAVALLMGVSLQTQFVEHAKSHLAVHQRHFFQRLEKERDLAFVILLFKFLPALIRGGRIDIYIILCS